MSKKSIGNCWNLEPKPVLQGMPRNVFLPVASYLAKTTYWLEKQWLQKKMSMSICYICPKGKILHQLIWQIIIPLFTWVSYIPSGAGFLPSTVCAWHSCSPIQNKIQHGFLHV